MDESMPSTPLMRVSAADEADNVNLAATRENQACQYSEWSDWSPCSRTCGSGGVQERQRRLLNVDDQLRTTCGATLRLRRRMCSNLPPCNAADSQTVSFDVVLTRGPEADQLSQRDRERGRSQDF